jgi:hypothetical protein
MYIQSGVPSITLYAILKIPVHISRINALFLVFIQFQKTSLFDIFFKLWLRRTELDESGTSAVSFSKSLMIFWTR